MSRVHGAVPERVAFDLFDDLSRGDEPRRGTLTLDGRTARIDAAGHRYVVHLDDVVGIERCGCAIQLRVRTNGLIEFGGVRWDGRYPPVRCADDAAADALVATLTRVTRVRRVRWRDRLPASDDVEIMPAGA